MDVIFFFFLVVCFDFHAFSRSVRIASIYFSTTLRLKLISRFDGEMWRFLSVAAHFDLLHFDRMSTVAVMVKTMTGIATQRLTYKVHFQLKFAHFGK